MQHPTHPNQQPPQGFEVRVREFLNSAQGLWYAAGAYVLGASLESTLGTNDAVWAGSALVIGAGATASGVTLFNQVNQAPTELGDRVFSSSNTTPALVTTGTGVAISVLGSAEHSRVLHHAGTWTFLAGTAFCAFSAGYQFSKAKNNRSNSPTPPTD